MSQKKYMLLESQSQLTKEVVHAIRFIVQCSNNRLSHIVILHYFLLLEFSHLALLPYFKFYSFNPILHTSTRGEQISQTDIS